jgi:hypothetical protein
MSATGKTGPSDDLRLRIDPSHYSAVTHRRGCADRAIDEQGNCVGCGAEAVIEWREETEGELRAYLRDRDKAVSWAPQSGSQEAFDACTTFEVLFEGSRGPGKGLPLDEPVYTPMGPRPIGDLRVGDRVCAPDGTESTVIGVYPQGVRPVYEFEFDDGAIARCDDQHIWPIHVQGLRVKRDIPYRLMTTDQVIDRFERGNRLHIPTLNALEMRRSPRLRAWPVEPYVLGLLLGDGSMRKDGSVLFVTVDDELASVVVNAGMVEWAPDPRNGLRTFGACRGSSIYEGLRTLGLLRKRSWEKRVPKMYRHAPKSVRLAVLRGLMDTDGSVDRRGYVEFSSCSKELTADVQWLVRSLGGKATATVKETGHRPAHRLYVQTGDTVPFGLPRKASRCRAYQHDLLRRRIVSIRPIEPRETVCIKVDHPAGLFVTRDLVVTHNTDSLLMSYAQHVGRGYGADWRGIIFRKTFPELRDIVAKSRKWFREIFPRATFNKQAHEWTFPGGEVLIFGYIERPSDYDKYHGHAYPFIGFEELTTHADPACYKLMFSCCRSTNPRVPRMIRATCNPYGVGHNWVKARFELPIHHGRIVGPLIETEGEPDRRAIHGSLFENKILLTAEPDYPDRIRAAARNPQQLDAWLNGNWDVTSGGMIDDLWTPAIHVIDPIPLAAIPSGWRLDRSYDDGQSHPFSVGWWAESNGEPVQFAGAWYGPVRGDLIRVQEWYGWTGQPNEGLRIGSGEIAKGILEREKKWGVAGRVATGVADSSIFNPDPRDPRSSVASDMEAEGVRWDPADKGPGSRSQGWMQLRKRLKASIPDNGRREEPGIFVSSVCKQFLRTMPTLPRGEDNPDDVPKKAEAHIADETRYRCRHVPRVSTSAYTGMVY